MIKKFVIGVLHINPTVNEIKQTILIIENIDENSAIGEAWGQSKIKFPPQKGWLVQDIIVINLDSNEELDFGKFTDEYEAE